MFLVQYPLPYFFLSLVYWPIHILTGMDVVSAAPVLVIATFFLLMASSGWAAYEWLKSWCSPAAALFGALLFMFAPYHFGLDLYRRYALGELVAYTLIPIVLLFTRSLVTRRKIRAHFVVLAFVFAALICSHPISAALLIPLIFVEAFLAGPAHPNWKRISGICLAVIIGILLSSFYLFPFIASYHDVTAHPLHNRAYDYDDNYLKVPIDSVQPSLRRHGIPESIQKIVTRSLEVMGPAFTRKGKYPGFAPVLSLIDDLLMSLAGVACWLMAGRLWRDKSAAVWLVIGILSVYVQFYPSHWIADLLSPLKTIQFPWRFSTITCIALAAVGARAWDSIQALQLPRSRVVRQASLATAIFVLLVCGNIAALSASDFRRQPTLTGRDAEMYPLYTGHKFNGRGVRLPPLQLLPSRLRSTGRAWRVVRGIARTFLIYTGPGDAGTAEINLICFPGWKAIDLKSKKPLAIGCDNTTGLALIDLPQGTTEIKMYFPLRAADYIGRTVSLVLVICLLLFAIASGEFRDSRRFKRIPARVQSEP